jgi:hypothetical protein
MVRYSPVKHNILRRLRPVVDRQEEFASRLAAIGLNPIESVDHYLEKYPQLATKEGVETLINSQLAKLPYFVERTEYGKALPVYTDYKHNRQQKKTIIRRIFGSIQALANDLKSIFPPDHVKIHRQKNQIIIKGTKDLECKYWLANKGF